MFIESKFKLISLNELKELYPYLKEYKNCKSDRNEYIFYKKFIEIVQKM